MFNFLKRKKKKEIWIDMYDTDTGKSVLKMPLSSIKHFVNLHNGCYKPLEYSFEGFLQIVFYWKGGD